MPFAGLTDAKKYSKNNTTEEQKTQQRRHRKDPLQSTAAAAESGAERKNEMAVITFVCAGQMNSAITFPAFENGHEVRLVGSPLDREIIDHLREDNFHITLKRTLHDGIKYY